MIELCSRRRMLAAIIVLVCVSIIIVLLENILTPDGVHGRRVAISSEPPAAEVSGNVSAAVPSVAVSATGRPCWQSQAFTITRACRRCLDFEKASGSIPECLNHQHVEVLSCEKDGKVFRGCDGARDRAVRQFWLLELVSLCAALVSGGAVIVRQHQLERGALIKIQRQLASQV